MTRDPKDIVDSRPIRRRGWYIIWVIASVVTVVLCYNVRPHVSYSDEFVVLLNAINVVSYSLGVGLPIFLAASISVSSTGARHHAQNMYESGASPWRILLRRLSESSFLSLVFVLSITLVLFIEPVLTGVTFYNPQGTGYLIYIPAVFLASLSVSLILSTVGVFLAAFTDDVILSASLGSAITIYLATLIGWAPVNLWYSLTRSIAILSPHNLVKILAASLTDYENPFGNPIASLVGFEPALEAILLTLLLFLGLAILCSVASVRILHHNLSHWYTRYNMTNQGDIWTPAANDYPAGSDERINRELRLRRVGLVMVVGFLLVTMSLATSSYQTTVREETTIIFYQSPANGEPVVLGNWYIFPCDVQTIQYDQFIFLNYDCDLIDWGSAPSEVNFFYSLLNMSSDAFSGMNETVQRDQCKSRNRTRGEWGGMSGSWNLGYDYGSYIFVLEIIAAQNASLSGAMVFSIMLYQSTGW